MWKNRCGCGNKFTRKLGCGLIAFGALMLIAFILPAWFVVFIECLVIICVGFLLLR